MNFLCESVVVVAVDFIQFGTESNIYRVDQATREKNASEKL